MHGMGGKHITAKVAGLLHFNITTHRCLFVTEIDYMCQGVTECDIISPFGAGQQNLLYWATNGQQVYAKK